MGSLSGSTAGASRKSRSPFTPPPHWRQLHVLVAEDHSAHRLLLGCLLRKLGLDHELVADGYLGRVAYARRPFDLVITDCQMPVMDGYSMARAIRQYEHHFGLRRVPIIALTADLQNDSPRRCSDAGIDAWLLKPLTLEQLRAVLARWLPDADHVPIGEEPVARVSGWPARASLVATFGSEQVVNQLLENLLVEAWQDHDLLGRACAALDASLTAERLHRLTGSLVFVGGTGLESCAVRLIEQVQRDGVSAHLAELTLFQARLRAYLDYLSTL